MICFLMACQCSSAVQHLKTIKYKTFEKYKEVAEVNEKLNEKSIEQKLNKKKLCLWAQRTFEHVQRPEMFLQKIFLLEECSALLALEHVRNCHVSSESLF